MDDSKKKKKWVFTWTKPRKIAVRKPVVKVVEAKPLPETICFADDSLGRRLPAQIPDAVNFSDNELGPPAPLKINWDKVEKAFKQKTPQEKLAEEFKRLKFDSLLLPKKIVLPPRDWG